MKQIEYQKYFGEIRFPDGFEEELRGKTIEEQIGCYAIAGAKLHEMSYHTAEEKRIRSFLPVNTDHYDLIVRDGIVVGFMSGSRPLLPYSHVYTEGSASDNNGAGYKYREGTDFYLVCVPPDPARPVCAYPPFGAPVHTITVPVTQVDDGAALPEEFLAQIKGKSIAEQLDYYWVLGEEDEIKPMFVADAPACAKRWSSWAYPKLLRYDENLQEIFVKDGVIVGVAYRSTYPKYYFEKRCIIKAGDVVKIRELFWDKYEDCNILFSRAYILQPILYK